jgi:hypothetical protein
MHQSILGKRGAWAIEPGFFGVNSKGYVTVKCGNSIRHREETQGSLRAKKSFHI